MRTQLQDSVTFETYCYKDGELKKEAFNPDTADVYLVDHPTFERHRLILRALTTQNWSQLPHPQGDGAWNIQVPTKN